MDSKKLAYAVLARNRYATKPADVSQRQWEAIKSAMERKFTKEYMDTPEGLYTDAQIWAQTFRKYIEQIFIDFAINEASSVDVAQVFNVDADSILDTLLDFRKEWNEAEEPEDADGIIDKYVDLFMYDGDVEDVRLTKHNHGADYLEWTYYGKDYWAQGEYEVDADNNLHQLFIAPNGKEIEIVTPYE